jgi:3-methyl-2-oxobutanoate hydroxymethyltransferase
MIDGVAKYADDVRHRRYPEEEHGYTMAPDEAERVRDMLDHEAHAREPFSGDW